MSKYCEVSRTVHFRVAMIILIFQLNAHDTIEYIYIITNSLLHDYILITNLMH